MEQKKLAKVNLGMILPNVCYSCHHLPPGVPTETWKRGKIMVQRHGTWKNGQKSIGFCDQSWNFTNFTYAFYQVCDLNAAIKRVRDWFRKSMFSYRFRKMLRKQTLSRDPVIENWETVMEISRRQNYKVCGNPGCISPPMVHIYHVYCAPPPLCCQLHRPLHRNSVQTAGKKGE